MKDTIPVTHLIYAAATAASEPETERTLTGICRACGEHGTGQKFDDWVKPTFMDFDKLKSGEIICAACLFCFDDRNEILTRITSKEKPQRMRNYSHFVVNGEWIPLSKGDKPRMKELIMQLPDVAVIAVSGQKHIIFRARPGWWQIEEIGSRPFPATLSGLIEQVEELYVGFSKSEIETGRYPQHRIIKFGFDKWRELDSAISAARGGIALELALFLAQKDEDSEQDSR